MIHDTLNFILDEEQSRQLETGDFGFNIDILQGTAKVLTIRVIGRKIKKLFTLVEVLDLEEYVILKRRGFNK